jgi:hypothetical protein
MPAAIAPSEMPLPTNMTTSARRLCGAYSDARPIAFGNAAPSPRPVTKRMATKGHSDSTSTVSSVPNPNATQDQTTTVRRPIRSASGASSIAPSMTPTRPEVSAGQSWPRTRPHSAVIVGTTYVMP